MRYSSLAMLYKEGGLLLLAMRYRIIILILRLRYARAAYLTFPGVYGARDWFDTQ